ncbi:MFS transporter [Pseudomonas sp. 21LCFQ02]|uniref:NTP/NDP exchange transporter n=1 Tax=Pseudomonas sp. 21LCFQ02 TaxID=2957505 RepID=UPI00209BA658|nr:MFS transporter [Pseudomonas sp. 21LCFQ02]MCO8169187.1 MFS transporter [Pseudomonas sp. 21LCFQ02]
MPIAFAARLRRLLNVSPGEERVVSLGLAMFMLLFTGYFMLRPVREVMGLAGGVDNLQWLFTATFIATLAALPLFGLLASRLNRRSLLSAVFGFFVLNLLVFALLIQRDPDNVWTGRTFYVWLSVFNLLSISLAWSVLADVFSSAQARRVFALMAGGASFGGLLGPLLGTVLVAPLGHAGLLLLAALLLAGSLLAALSLLRWREREPLNEQRAEQRDKPLGGNPFAGATAVLRSPFLLGIALFVILLASASTFLYFEQARIVASHFPDRTTQTQVFGLLDTLVQSLAIFTQLFVTGRIAQKLGVTVLLVAVPLLIAGGFVLLALSPVFAVFAVVMVVRRAGEYALVRPGREMLYTVVSAEQKYKAKNFIDTVVYRGGDALSGWLKRGLDLLGEHPALAMYIGAGLALLWAWVGLRLGQAQRQRESSSISYAPRDTKPESDPTG